MTIEKRVIAILRDHLGIAEDRIVPDLLIMGEIDSPDHVELIMELEEEFDIAIPGGGGAEIRTVAQAIRYVEERTGRRKAGHTIPDSRARENPLWDRHLDGQ